MLGLLLIYFIGKTFYDQAGRQDRHQWGFAILGVVTYYFGTFLAGIVLTLFFDVWGNSSIADLPDLLLGLIALPFGILSCVILYFYLERQPKRKKKIDENILDELEGL